ARPTHAEQGAQPQQPATRDVQSLPSFSRLVESVKSAVVNVDVQSKTKGSSASERFGGMDPFEDFFGGSPRGGQPPPQGEGQIRQGAGSGFVIDPKGLIVTNNH